MNGHTLCAWHGRAPQVKLKAARTLQEREARAVAMRSLGQVDVAQLGDPISALEYAVAQSHGLARRLAELVAAIPDDQLRYQGKLGEQLRGEITASQRALADLARVSTDALKLGLAERRSRLEERMVDAIERALVASLEASGLDIDGQNKARVVLQRELKAIPAA